MNEKQSIVEVEWNTQGEDEEVGEWSRRRSDVTNKVNPEKLAVLFHFNTHNYQKSRAPVCAVLPPGRFCFSLAIPGRK